MATPAVLLRAVDFQVNPVVPTDLTGCTLWLDGSDQSTLTIVDGAVTQWNDKSGGSHNTTGVTGTPTYIPGSGVAFNGSSFLNLNDASMSTGDNSFSIYIVAHVNNNDAAYALFSAGGADPPNSRSVKINTNTTGTVSISNGWGYYATPSNTYQVGNSFIVYATHALGLSYLFLGLNGGVLNYVDTYGQDTASGNVILGSGIGSNLNGLISEIIIYNTAHTDSQRQVIEGYLAWKWNLNASMPQTYPYYLSPPSIWQDDSGNGKNATLASGTIIKNSEGNGVVFSGSTSWQFPDIGITSTDSWSVSIWYKQVYNASTSLIVGQSGGPINRIQSINNSTVNFFYANSGYSTPVPITTDVWINIQFTFDIADSNNVKTYVNGVLVETIGGQAFANPLLPYYIGGVGLFGEIGEIIIYKSALDQTAVTALYNSTYKVYNKSLLVLLKAVNYVSGTTWNNETGNTFDATLENGVGATKNVAGNGLILDGSVYWTFSDVQVNNYWTMSSWYKVTDPTVATSIITQKGTTDYNTNMYYTTSTVNGQYKVSSTTYTGASTSIIPGVWTNIQITWDGTNMKTYVNGVLNNTTKLSGIAATGGLQYYIGALATTTNQTSGFAVGEIGEVRIYTYPLTQAQVTADYNASYAIFNKLMVLLKAVNYSSGAWNNETGNGFNATKDGGGNLTKNGAGNGIVLDGTSTFLNISNLGLGNSWTVAVWYKQSAAPAGDYPCIVTQNSASTNLLLGFKVAGGDGLLSGGFYNTAAISRGTTTSLTTGSWTNIQVTWDGQNMKTYVNNVLLGTVAISGRAVDAVQGYRIGRQWATGSYVAGEIGEVRLYTYAITPTQVMADYDASYYTFEPPNIPAVPIIFKRPKVQSNTIRYDWRAPALYGGQPYTYVLSTQGNSYTLPSSATAYVIRGLTSGVLYTYSIRAVNSIGSSPSATYNSVYVGPVPPQLTTAVAIKSGSDTAIIRKCYNTGLDSHHIKWVAARTNIVIGSGEVYKNGIPFGDDQMIINNNPSYITNNLDLTNNMYTFNMSYVNDSGYSVDYETNPIGNVQYTLTSPTGFATTRNYSSIASSSNGQIMVTCERSPGYVRTTRDRGVTWVQANGPPESDWLSVACSSDGSKMLAVGVGTTDIWTSWDSGITWVARSTSFSVGFVAVAISPDGAYAAAAGYASNNIYISSNSGATWTQSGLSQTTYQWNSLTISNGGTNLYACQYGGLAWKSTNSGVDWSGLRYSPVTYYGNWNRIISDSTGQYLIVGDTNNAGVWRSSDYGVTWTYLSGVLQSQAITSLANSSNGQTVFAIRGGDNVLFISYNSATSWVQVPDTADSSFTGDLDFYGKVNLNVACSGNGLIVYLTAYTGSSGDNKNYIWKGTYSSPVWNFTKITARDVDTYGPIGLNPIVCSKDGVYVYLAIANSQLYMSSDSGGTWAAITTGPTVSNTGAGQLSCSDDGLVLMYTSNPVSVGIYTPGTSSWSWTSPTFSGNALGGNVGAISAVINPGNSYKLVVANQGGAFYISTDTGATWTLNSNSSIVNSTYAGIAISSTGSTIAVTASRNVYITRNTGTTWYTQLYYAAWLYIYPSSDYTKILIVGQNEYILLSTDSGATWTTLVGAGKRNWYSATVSTDFTKIAAVAPTEYIWTTTNSGVTWNSANQVGYPNFSAITGNSTGEYLAAVVVNGPIWYGRSFGSQWYTYATLPTSYWTRVKMSNDGSLIFAGNGYFNTYISNDGGVNWKLMAYFQTGSFSVVISADNTFLALAPTFASYILTSSDSGYTWVPQTNSQNTVWSAMAGSSDGRILFAAQNSDNKHIYKSVDYGVTWTRVREGDGGITWTCMASDSTGTYIAVGTTNNYIFTSSDSGATWVPQTGSPIVAWNDIASDSTGKYLVAGVNNGYLYTSQDYGLTWAVEASLGVGNWNVTCSSYGNNIVVTSSSANFIMWASSDFGVTWSRQLGALGSGWSLISCSGSASKFIVVSAGPLVLGTVG